MATLAAQCQPEGEGATIDERRRDLALRSVVDRCEAALRPLGFHLGCRGSSPDNSWVRFQRQQTDADGRLGTMSVLVAHGRRDRAFIVAQYYEDGTLAVQTPIRRLVQRYVSAGDLPTLMDEIVQSIRGWT
jgi:hypothetical protein